MTFPSGDDELSALLEHSQDVILVVDADGTTRYVTPAIERMLGYDPDEVVGDNAFDYMHPEERDEVFERFASLVDAPGASTDRVRHRLQAADGSWVWVESVGSNHTDAAIDGYVINSRDVSDVVERERDLRLTRRAVEASAEAIYVTDPDGRIEYVNPAFEQITGYDAEEAVGETPSVLKSGEMPEGYYEELWETVLAGEVWEEELVNRRKSGELYHARQTIAPIEDDEGSVVAFVAVQSDITDRVEREREFQTLVENLPGMVYRCRVEQGWPMEVVRGDVERLVGYAGDEIADGAVSWGADVVHPDDRDDVWETVLDSVDRGEPFELTYRVRTSGGADRWVWERGQAVEAVDADTPVLEGFIMDVTERRQLEGSLRESLRQLQVMDRVLRHNLHNDLNVVTGLAETIREESEGTVAERASSIVEESHRLLETVDKEREITSVLSESRQAERLDLAPVVETAVASVREGHPTAEVSVDQPDEAWVRATPDVDRAISELLTNAVTHSDADVPRVEVSVTSLGDVVEVRVADDGPGIPEADRAVLAGGAAVEPLYHGSGLGLWLVRLVVQGADGSVSVADDEPRGTVVTVRLPAASSEP